MTTTQKKKLHPLLKLILGLLLIPILALLGVLVYSTYTDYQPARSIELVSEQTYSDTSSTDTLTCLIWNIGYAGLGEDMDFFYDGGTTVRASEEKTNSYLNGITELLKNYNTIDFVFLQEVDSASKRTYYSNQIEHFKKNLPNYNTAFALNYHVDFVPVPFQLNYQPYGQTRAGLLSLSQFKAQTTTRYQYPGGFSWPESIFMLDRCFLEQRFVLPNGKKMALINTHNTAYDATGTIKKLEMEDLKHHTDSLYKAGYHVLVGGDFNQCPPYSNPNQFSKTIGEGYTRITLDPNSIASGFKVAVDTTAPTNRGLNVAYTSSKDPYLSIIDFFILSPNIEIISVKTLQQNFKYSDHEPVLLKFVIK